MMFFSKFKNSIDFERSIHSLKTAFACLVGFVLIRFSKFPLDQWLIITIIVVMTAQINVGSMLQKSYLRFLGTLVGSILAALTIIICGNHFLSSSIIIVLSVIFFSYLATGPSEIRDAGTLGAVTVVIILVGAHPTLWTAMDRFFEITGGILIAALVSQFILPIHAGAHLRRSQVQTLQQLRDYYQSVLIFQNNDQVIQDLEQPIIKSLTKQRTLAEMARREPFGKKFDSVHFNQFLQCEIEIMRSIDFMHYAYKHDSKTFELLKNISCLHEFHQQILSALQSIEEMIEHPKNKIGSISIPSLHLIKEDIQKLQQNLSNEEKLTVTGFLFCMQILVEQLNKLMLLYQIR